jgi:hypothetical protein
MIGPPQTVGTSTIPPRHSSNLPHTTHTSTRGTTPRNATQRRCCPSSSRPSGSACCWCTSGRSWAWPPSVPRPARGPWPRTWPPGRPSATSTASGARPSRSSRCVWVSVCVDVWVGVVLEASAAPRYPTKSRANSRRNCRSPTIRTHTRTHTRTHRWPRRTTGTASCTRG